MSYRVKYGNRMAPATTDKFVPVIKKLFSEKAIVSEKDMQKATGKKWVRGFLNAFSKSANGESVVPVKDGRVVIGYRLESKPLVLTKNGSFRGPDGHFVKVAASKPKKTTATKRPRKAATKTVAAASEVTVAAVEQALATPEPVQTPVVAPTEVATPTPRMVDDDMPAFLRKS